MSLYWAKMLDELSAEAYSSAAAFTYVQLPVDAVMQLDADGFARQKKELADRGLVPLAFTSPLPADVQVTEMGFNLYVWIEYLKKAVRRISELGCRKLLWNNGRARVMPWEGDIAGVQEQVLQFLYLLCDVCQEYDMTVLVEPLSPLRTNFLTSLEETVDFLDRVGKSNLASMLSLREMAEIGLTVDDLPRFIGRLKHIHLDNPRHHRGARVSPAANDGVDYQPFLRQLKQSGYRETIGLPQDADKDTLVYCQDLWQRL